MPIQLQISLFVSSCLVFYIILRNIKKSKLSTDMATIWIIWGLGLILISLFPQIVDFAGNIIGISTPINTIFLIMIFLLYILLFFLFVKISILEQKTKELIHIVALLKKEK